MLAILKARTVLSGLEKNGFVQAEGDCLEIRGMVHQVVGTLISVGTKKLMWEKIMGETTVKVDEKGRVIIPKSIRKTTKLKEGSYVNIKAEGKTIIMEAAEPAADKYYGTFKIAKWPEDIDEFIEKVMV